MIRDKIEKDNKYLAFLIKNLSNSLYNLKSESRNDIYKIQLMDFDTYQKSEIGKEIVDLISFFNTLNYSPKEIYQLINESRSNDILEIINTPYYAYMNQRKEIYNFFREVFVENFEYYKTAILNVLENHTIKDPSNLKYLQDEESNKKLIQNIIKENKEMFLDLIEIGKTQGYLAKIDKNLLITSNENYTEILHSLSVKEKDIFNIDHLLEKVDKNQSTKVETYLKTTLDTFLIDNPTYESFNQKYLNKIEACQRKTKSDISAFQILINIMNVQTEQFKEEQKQIIKNWLKSSEVKEKIGKMEDSSLEEAFNLHREIFLEEFKNEDYLKSTKTFDELINRVNSFILGNEKEFYLHIPRDIFNIDKKYYSYESGDNNYIKNIKLLFKLEQPGTEVEKIQLLEKTCHNLRDKLINSDRFTKENLESSVEWAEAYRVYEGMQFFTSTLFNDLISKSLEQNKKNEEIKKIYLDKNNQGLRLDFLKAPSEITEVNLLTYLESYENNMNACDDGTENYNKVKNEDKLIIKNHLEKILEPVNLKNKTNQMGNIKENFLERLNFINKLVQLSEDNSIYKNDAFLFHMETKQAKIYKNGKNIRKFLSYFPIYIELIINGNKNIWTHILTEDFVKKEQEFYKKQKDSYQDSYHLMTYVINNAKPKQLEELVQVLIEKPNLYKELCLKSKKITTLLENTENKFIINTMKVMKDVVNIEKKVKPTKNQIEPTTPIRNVKKI